MHLVVDAANVVGSRPNGWWRDRPGAAARLVDQLAAALRSGTLDSPVTVVLEGSARAGVPAESRPEPRLRVVHADTDGDSAIVELVRALAANACSPVAITADRALRTRVITAGGTVCRPSWLLARLRDLAQQQSAQSTSRDDGAQRGHYDEVPHVHEQPGMDNAGGQVAHQLHGMEQRQRLDH